MSLTPKGYTTKQEVEDFLFATLDPAYTAALSDLIAKAEDFMDRTCRRRFDSTTDDQVVPGNGKSVISIPDTLSLTGFEIDPLLGTLMRATYGAAGKDVDWTLEPVAAPNSNRPYTRLRLLAPALPLQPFVFANPGKTTLHGTFGWAEVPPAIRLATTMLVAEATRRWRNPESGDIASLTEGNYSVTFAQVAAKPEWQNLITPYKRPRTVIY
jgi:hypothetical protein